MQFFPSTLFIVYIRVTLIHEILDNNKTVIKRRVIKYINLITL